MFCGGNYSRMCTRYENVHSTKLFSFVYTSMWYNNANNETWSIRTNAKEHQYVIWNSSTLCVFDVHPKSFKNQRKKFPVGFINGEKCSDIRPVPFSTIEYLHSCYYTSIISNGLELGHNQKLNSCIHSEEMFCAQRCKRYERDDVVLLVCWDEEEDGQRCT